MGRQREHLHPIVAQLTPSEEQEPAITARGHDLSGSSPSGRSLAVTAGAGTGKTRTLVARYLSLLAEEPDTAGDTAHSGVRGLVAITFTRKAAREMRNRVREEIRRYLSCPALDGQELQRWQDIYTGLDAARIGTIHSLCTEILRSHPAEAQVDPRFEVLDEGQATVLQTRAVEEALAWAADEPQVVGLFALGGERDLRDTLTWMLRQRLDVEVAFRNLPEPLWPHWEARLLPPIQAFVDSSTVNSLFDDLLALRADGTLHRAEAAGDRLALPLGHLLSLWDEILTAHQEGDWQTISSRLAPLRSEMKLVGRAANWAPADPKAVLKDLRASYDDHLAAVNGKGMDLAHDQQLAEAMPALRAIYRQTAASFQRLKDGLQALDFDDLEQGALSLLEEHSAIRSHWQAMVRAILVDEFQDTNRRQRDLVACLDGGEGLPSSAVGGKLFFVGDAKQSIYRFRGADVTVFREERDRVKREGGLSYELATSYRAHRALVQGLNDLLRPVLGEVADPERPWAEPFSALRPHREEPGPGFTAPFIELHLTVGSKSAGALDRAADALAARLATLVKEGAVGGGKDNPPRALKYDDCAILCRASSSFAAYEDALERAGVPFLTVAGRGFYNRPEIRDLLNALQALADPTDSLALAGLLRSPAFALSDAALYHLRKGKEGRATPLWERLSAGRAAPAVGDQRSAYQACHGSTEVSPQSAMDQYGLSTEDASRAARAVDTIAWLHGQAGRTTVADLLKAFLDETDYRAALLQAGQARAARNVAKLLADAQASGIVGIGEFLEYVAGLRDAGAREGEARALTEGAVQIMSVHAAKGLEFPVVVLGDVTYGPRGRTSPLVDEDGILLPIKDEEGRLPALYRLAQVRAGDQEAAETDRLLYVAATRAREKLLLSGCIKLRKDGTPGKQGGWLGRLAGPECLGLADATVPHDDEGDAAISIELQVGETPVGCTIYEPGLAWPQRSLASQEVTVGDNPLPPPLLAAVTPAAWPGKEGERPPQRVWQVVPDVARPRAPSWVVGSLVHEALAAWRFPDGNAGDGPDGRFAKWATARARSYGLTDARQLGDAVRRCRALLLRFRDDKLHAEMDSADRRLHEVPYSLEVEDRVDSGTLDAIYLHDGAWTVVEFKTDDVRDEDGMAQMLARVEYVEQRQRYQAAAGRLLGRSPRFLLCLLNYSGRVRVESLKYRGTEECIQPSVSL